MHFLCCIFLQDVQKEILLLLFKAVVMGMYLKIRDKVIQTLETAGSEMKKESLNHSCFVPVP